MKPSELRELSPEELGQKLSTLKRELLDLRMKSTLGKLGESHRILACRRDAARIKTILNEKSKQGAP